MKDFSLLYVSNMHEDNIQSQVNLRIQLKHNSELIEDMQIKLISQFLFPDNKVVKSPEDFLDLLCIDGRDIVFRQQIILDLIDNPSFADAFRSIAKLLEQLKVLADEYTRRKEEWIKLDILYRLLNKYIECIDILMDAFKVNIGIKSKGLIGLKDWINTKYEQESLAKLKDTLAEIKIKYKDIKGLIIGINVDEYCIPQALTVEKLICDDFYINGSPNDLNRTDGIPSINMLSNLANFKDFQILGAFLNEKLKKLLKEQTNMIRTKLSPFTKIDVRTLEMQYTAIVFLLAAVKWYSYFSTKGMVMAQPVIHEKSFALNLKEGYSPILAIKISAAEISSNDIELNQNNYVVTGANSAGKTTILRTIALNQLLFSAGLHVCAKEAEFSVSNSMFSFFSTGETIEDSRFAMEVIRFESIINNVTDNSFVFLNEPLSSTNPDEGVKICASMLKRLTEKGATVITVTHYYELYNLLKAESESVVSLMMKKEEQRKIISEKSSNVGEINNYALTGINKKYRLIKQEPDGINYAKEIAEQFGFSFELILNKHHINSYGERYAVLREVVL